MRNQLPQIVALSASILAGCEAISDESSSDYSDNLVAETAKNALETQVFLKGGTFLLGDVGVLDGNPYTTLRDNNKPPIKVTLDGFSISKYETTWADFMIYLRDVGRASNYTEKYSYVTEIAVDNELMSPNFREKPARSPNFDEAAGYCRWLAHKTGQPFSLPTEAQWEFAARNRGKNTPYATNTGEVENDTYLARPKEHIDPSIPAKGNTLIHSSTTAERRPVGTYPASPIGLYDMTGNVAEWTQDWYQENYYALAPSENPQGPGSPPNPKKATKVVRDWAGRGEKWGEAGTVFARSGESVKSSANGFRCVVNSPKPIN